MSIHQQRLDFLPSSDIREVIDYLSSYISRPKTRGSCICYGFDDYQRYRGVLLGYRVIETVMNVRFIKCPTSGDYHPAAPGMLWDSAYLDDRRGDTPKRLEFAKALRHWLRAVLKNRGDL